MVRTDRKIHKAAICMRHVMFRSLFGLRTLIRFLETICDADPIPLPGCVGKHQSRCATESLPHIERTLRFRS